MDNKRIAYLYNRYLSQSLSAAELDELKKLLSSGMYDRFFNELIDNEWKNLKNDELLDVSRENMDAAFDHIVTRPQKSKKTISIWPRIAAAASIIFVLGTGAYFYFHKSPETQQTAQNQKNDIAPGSNKAVLTLANGKRIILTGVKNGMLAKQAGVTITKTADGQVVYSVEHSIHNVGEPEYNIVETPKGGQYQITLPDGSHVWLNAASSLKYPAQFADNERKVELTGEAYFEVAKDKAHPFIVSTSKQDVQVLGTHFNINSYDDEPVVKTTLLEGSINLIEKSANHSRILKPGEQAVLNASELTVRKADLQEVIAWKNGEFLFNEDDFHTAMRKISRWYDVDIVYDQSAPNDFELGGFVSRSKNISAVLKLIQLTGKVHFKIEGRRILVTR